MAEILSVSNITYKETIEAISCCRCGVWFGMAASLYDERLKDHKIFYCPNGHQQHFTGISDAEKLREVQEQLRATRDLLHHEERSHASTRGHLTRTKKRVAAGVCPCCNRSFQNLAAHMKDQHPRYNERTEKKK